MPDLVKLGLWDKEKNRPRENAKQYVKENQQAIRESNLRSQAARGGEASRRISERGIGEATRPSNRLGLSGLKAAGSARSTIQQPPEVDLTGKSGRFYLSEIAQIADDDPAEGERLYGMYQEEKANPDSPLYDKYDTATAASGRYSAQNAARTEKAKAEWAGLQKELAYWANSDRDYSDDEIISRINWKNYPTLAKMDADRRGEGSTVYLTEPVGYNEDAMYGVLWAARNPDISSGDAQTDSVLSAMGLGKQYQRDEAKAGRLNPGSESYNPHLVGSTLDDEMQYFGVNGFDRDWVEKNRAAILGSGDETAIKNWQTVYKAQERQDEAQAELDELNGQIDSLLRADPTMDADALIDMVFNDSNGAPRYSVLSSIDEGLYMGKPVALTGKLDYDRKDIEASIRQRVATARANQEAASSPEALTAAVEQEKQATIDQNGSLVSEKGKLPDKGASVPETVYDSQPDKVLEEGVLWAGTTASHGRMATSANLDIAKQTGQAPTADGLAKDLGITQKQAEEMLAQMKQQAQEDAARQQPTEVKAAPEKAVSEAAEEKVPQPEEQAAVAEDATEGAPAEEDYVPLTADQRLQLADAIFAAAGNGDYETAAKMQYELVLNAVNQSGDDYVQELVHSEGNQKAALALCQMVSNSDMLERLDDPNVQAELEQYQYYIEQTFDLDHNAMTEIADWVEQTAGNVGQYVDQALGGAISDTQGNEGLGFWQTLLQAGKRGALKIDEWLATVTGAVISGYGMAVKGTNQVINAVFGTDLNNSLADQTVEAGQAVSRYYQPMLASQEEYLRENASTLEYFGVEAASEAIKMGAQSVVGGGIGRAATGLGAAGAIRWEDGARALTTAQTAAKLETIFGMSAMTPFVAESGASELNQTYAETGNEVLSLVCGLTAAFGTLATSNLDVIHNIEAGSLREAIPEVVDKLTAVPGTGTAATLARWGKAGVLYLGNLLKTGLNEAIQEPVENLLTTWATTQAKGENFFTSTDWGEYAKELTQDSLMGFLGSVGNSLCAFPAYARSVKVANANMGKSALTGADVTAQLTAFLDDLNDPIVMGEAAKNAQAIAVESTTGDLLAQGAMEQVDTARVDAAQEAADKARTVFADAKTQLTATGEHVYALNEKVNQNPANEQNRKDLSDAITQWGKDNQAAQQALRDTNEANAKLKKARGEVKAQQDAALNAVRQQAETLVQKAYDIKKVDFAVARQNVDANIQQVAQMDSVAVLNGDEFSIDSENIKQDVADYFDSIGGVVSNPVLGDVALTKKGAKTSVSHGMGPKKAIAFAAVPAVIENGKILDVQQNWKNRQYDTFVLAAPVTIESGKYAGQYVEGVIVKRNAQDQSFYLHEVLLMDENSGRVTPIVPGSLNPKADATPSDAYMPATNSSLLQNAADVKQTAVPANEEGANVAVQPTVRPNESSVALGGAKAPSVNSILQKVIDVKQGKMSENADASIPAQNGQNTAPAANVQENEQVGGNGAETSRKGAQTASETPRMGQSQFATKTGQNTDVLTDATKQKLRENPFYQKLNQKESVERAISKVEKEGYTARMNRMLTGGTDILTPDGQTEAYVLSQIAKENGDTEGQAALAFKVKESGTFLAQSLAMRRLYTEMSPEAKVSYVQKLVDQINDQYESKGKDTRVTLPGWVEQAVMEAGDDQKRLSNVLDQAYREIAQQMPYTVGDTLRTWRFLSMLGNPLTHFKNMAANAAFMPYVAVKNRVAAGLEATVSAAQEAMGKETMERSKTFGPLKAEYKAYASDLCAQMEDVLSGSEKANATNGKSKVDEYRQKAPALIDWLSRKNADLLGGEDLMAKNHYFKYALASYLQANQVDLSNVSDTMLANATQYAVNEAYKNTFNNVNEFAKWLSKTERSLADSANPVARGAGLLLEGTVPFKNTPANIVSRGVEYSPVGLFNAIFLNYAKLKKGVDYQGNAFTMQNYLDGIASGLTGTAAVALGGLLASAGVLDLGDDDDDEVRGKNKNSVNIPGTDINIGIDWSGVAAMPLLMGAQLWKRWTDKGENPLTFNDFLNGFKSVADPVMDLSMVQGITGLLDTASYSDNALGTMATKMATSYLGQFVPTVFGAITRTFFDDTRRTTYTDKNKDLSSETQYLLQSMRNKIPGLSKEGMAYLDAWGNEQKTDSLLERFLTNFIIPGYAKRIRTDDEVTEALLEMYDEYGDSGYLPTKAKKYFTADGERYDLSQAEYTQYAKERGSMAHDLLGDLMKDEAFRAAEPEFQLDAITDVWKYASQTAAYNVNDGFKRDSWVATTGSPKETILEKMQDRIVTADRNKFKESFFDAYEAGDVRSMRMCVAGLEQYGYQKNNLRKAVKERYQQQYRQMYEAGDLDGMRDLRDAMLAADIGFKATDFDKWLEDGKK